MDIVTVSNEAFQKFLQRFIDDRLENKNTFDIINKVILFFLLIKIIGPLLYSFINSILDFKLVSSI